MRGAEGVGRGGRTETDAGILLTDSLAVVIRKEHVGGQTTLGRIGVYGND